jgi:hypothetical protein
MLRGTYCRRSQLDTGWQAHLNKCRIGRPRIDDTALDGECRRKATLSACVGFRHVCSAGTRESAACQAGDAEAKLTRLYEAIENGLAELDETNLKGRISELKRIRDAARADVERAEARDAKAAEITPEALARFSRLAREGLRREDGTFRRGHVQKLVQRA